MSETTFRTGEHVIYKNNGVCRIDDIRIMTFGDTKKKYYVLSPLSGGTVYVPTEGPLPLKMKKVPAKEDVDRLIAQAEHSELKWIENSKLRILTFDKLLASSDRSAILWLVKVLSARKENEATKNKRLCANEERILSAAEKIITEEFAFALNLDKKEVIPYILKKISEI